jgi:hypothetical protein
VEASRDLKYLRRLRLQSHARSDEGHWRKNGDSLQPISGVRVAVACYPQMFVQSIGWSWLHVLLAWSVGALAASRSSRAGEKVIGMEATCKYSIIRNVKNRQRESGWWHMAAVRGKSKGPVLGPCETYLSGSPTGLLRQLEDRLRVPLQNSRPGTRKSKGSQHEAKQSHIQATYATERIHEPELRWSLEHKSEHLDPIIRFDHHQRILFSPTTKTAIPPPRPQ